VIVAFDFQIFPATSTGARQPESDLYNLCATVGKCNAFRAWHNFLNDLRDLEFEIVLTSEGVTSVEMETDLLTDSDRSMTEDKRAPPQHVVDVTIAINILDIRTGAVAEI
jgi:hypothetical protein